MAKPRRKPAAASGEGGSLTSWGAWLAVGAVVVVALATWRGRGGRPAPSGKPDAANAEEVEALERQTEQLDMVRNALFGGANGQYVKDEDTDDWKFSKGKQGFASADYWEETYKNSDRQYDWYGTWLSGIQGAPESALRDIIGPSLSGGAETVVLNLGCGNSRLSEEMHDDGYQNITNVDISHAVIKKMRARNEHREPQMSYIQMDISQMSCADTSFDLVIEKGTLDALYTGSTSLVPLAVDEVWRILRPGGVFASITFGKPQARWQLFKPPSYPGWVDRRHRAIKKPLLAAQSAPGEKPAEDKHGVIYVYTLRKPKAGEAVPPLTSNEQEEVSKRRRQMAEAFK